MSKLNLQPMPDGGVCLKDKPGNYLRFFEDKAEIIAIDCFEDIELYRNIIPGFEMFDQIVLEKKPTTPEDMFLDHEIIGIHFRKILPK